MVINLVTSLEEVSSLFVAIAQKEIIFSTILFVIVLESGFISCVVNWCI